VARIKDSSVEAVKAAVDIVAVVEGRTRWRKQGASLKGLCPFHQEKTPSFSVMPDRGIYHCFGCGEGGDAIDFVEKTEGVDFVGAIEWLADRGNDYFQRRLLFPLADARGRIRGFQARQLHDDDPLRAKYVNSPEGALFRKGDLLYGLHQARPAIAKEDRAVVVEGNTDVLALRHAGFEPVVASMGTALTENQLRELGRLTKRLFLCFDADAAGQDATLRGMELAIARGFEVYVVPLEPGRDPADDPHAFQTRLASPEP